MPKYFANKKLLALMLLCLMLSAFSGCGTKGPLYIPEREYPQQ